MKPVVFINLLRKSDFYIKHIYTEGGCYQFYKILKKLWPLSEAYINNKEDHVITKIWDTYYDITGVVDGRGFRPLNNIHLKKVKKWSFRNNNLLQLTECPACEEPLTYNEIK